MEKSLLPKTVKESPGVLKLALPHSEQCSLPKGDGLACATFKEAASKWFRLSANVLSEAQKTGTPARAVPGNTLSGVCRR